jgi:hypothetical protein
LGNISFNFFLSNSFFISVHLHDLNYTAFFLLATVFLGPLRVRALERVF